MADGDMADGNLADGGAADGGLHDQIARLEARIDGLAETLERCRKIALASKVAIAAGAIGMAAMTLGAIRFDPIAMLAAMTAVIGGIVVFGSNDSTSKQTSARMNDAEALRVELIGRLELRIVEGGLAAQDL
jgi:hypothetical protein